VPIDTGDFDIAATPTGQVGDDDIPF